MSLLSARRQPKIESHGKERVSLFLRRRHGDERLNGGLKAFPAPFFGLRGGGRTGIVEETIRMADMVRALSD